MDREEESPKNASSARGASHDVGPLRQADSVGLMFSLRADSGEWSQNEQRVHRIESSSISQSSAITAKVSGAIKEALSFAGESDDGCDECEGEYSDHNRRKAATPPSEVPIGQPQVGRVILPRNVPLERLTRDEGRMSSNSLASRDSMRSNLTNYKRQTQVMNVSTAFRHVHKKFDKLHLNWDSGSRTVVIVVKIYDRDNIVKCSEATLWMLKQGVRVYVEDAVLYAKEFNKENVYAHMLSQGQPTSGSESPLQQWDRRFCEENETTPDAIITFGGDGTILHAGWLFNKFCPPIISFDLGSLGFLATFSYSSFRETVSSILKLHGGPKCESPLIKDQDDEYSISFRMRLACVICKRSELPKLQKSSSNPVKENKWNHGFNVDVSILDSEPVNVLNDAVIDRGPTTCMCEVEMYIDGTFLTLIRADGLVISTPTGTTAYSLSAGGPLMHPTLSAIMITPICPHTVSFRPMAFPSTVTIRITVSEFSRAAAWASFDGKGRVKLDRGDSVIVCASNHSLPIIAQYGTTADWFTKIENCLGWNRFYPKGYAGHTRTRAEGDRKEATDEGN